jgi:DNA-binding transcriptional ArsR family regulator
MLGQTFKYEVKGDGRLLDNLPERKLFSGGSPSLEFDEHFTSTARLSIISALISGESLSFMELKRETGLADGNLHVQTHKLAEAGYLEIRKVSRGRRSATSFRVSELGIAALKRYVRGLQAILGRESGVIAPRSRRGEDDDSQVWS